MQYDRFLLDQPLVKNQLAVQWATTPPWMSLYLLNLLVK